MRVGVCVGVRVSVGVAVIVAVEVGVGGEPGAGAMTAGIIALVVSMLSLAWGVRLLRNDR